MCWTYLHQSVDLCVGQERPALTLCWICLPQSVVPVDSERYGGIETRQVGLNSGSIRGAGVVATPGQVIGMLAAVVWSASPEERSTFQRELKVGDSAR